MSDQSVPTTFSQRESPDAQLEILYVEDNPAHVRLFREALAEMDSNTRLHSVEDGAAAVEELNGRVNGAAASLPGLVLVDLHLSGQDGTDVIETVRAHPDLRSLPTIIFTSSIAEEDVTRCYESGANAFLTKPTQLDELISLVKAVERFWLGEARLPSDSS